MISIVLFIFNEDIFNDLTVTISVIGDVMNFQLAIVKITFINVFKTCVVIQIFNISDVIVIDDVISDVDIVDIIVVDDVIQT